MDEKKAATIGRLLALAERAGTPEEAQAASEKAERLMLKYGIEEAMARAAHGGAEVKPEKIITKTIVPPVPGSYARSHCEMMFKIARSLDLDGYRANNWSSFTVVGHEGDVERFEMLVNSLSLQVASAMKKWWKENKVAYAWETPHEQFLHRYSFVIAFGNVVASRLKTVSKEEQEQIPGSALVLRDRKKEVQDFVADMKLKPGRSSNAYRGSAAGAEAGRNANLGEKSVGGRKTLS